MSLPSPPPVDPNPTTIEPWREFALAYLREQFGPHAPTELGPPALFPQSPLEGDGAAFVFPFIAAPGGNEPQEFAAVVGRTEANYYPAASLSPEQLYDVHLGTRFMLTVGISQADESERRAYDPTDDVTALIRQVAPGEAVDGVALETMFRVGDERHAVCTCRVAGEALYIMTRDCPPGFYRLTHLPPHVVYRLHLGQLLRQEAADEARAERRTT